MNLREPPSPTNSLTYQSSIIQELLKGREYAAELQDLLQNSLRDCKSETVNELIEKVMKAFEDTVSMLNSVDDRQNSDNSAAGHVYSLNVADSMIEYSKDKGKIVGAKERRRAYKRRRLMDSWTKVSPTPFMDGHGWRKYGQKEILGAKYPRCYFRCTHRHDQGCLATKQVQQMEDDPTKYLITYMGNHTCKDLTRTPQVILDSTFNGPFSLTFKTSSTQKREHPISIIPSMKREDQDEITSDFPNYTSSSSLMSSSSPLSTSSENNFQFDLSIFDSCEPVTKLPSVTTADRGDSLSKSTTKSNTLGLEMKVDSIDQFDDMLCFDAGDLFDE